MDDRGFDALSRRIFAVTSRRTAFAALTGVLGMLGALLQRDAAAQRIPKLCRPLGQVCFPDRGIGCCGKVACRQGRCRCGRQQRACHGRCIGRHRCCHNRDCGRGRRCRKGRCACPGGTRLCGKRCVNLKSSKRHCGTCGNVCAGTAVCKQGVCVGGSRYRVVRRFGGGELNAPFGITLGPGGDLYVTEDRRGGNIARFTQHGKLVQTWAAGGNYVAGISVSPSGVLYVALYGERTIKTFTADGKPGLTFATGTRPLGLAVGPNGDVYVAGIDSEVLGATQLISAPGFANGEIQQYSASGVPKTTWDTPDSGMPTALTVNQVALRIFASIINQNNNLAVMMVLSLTGLIKSQWGSAGAGKGQFKNPSGIATDAAGDVYVADPGNNRVQKFHADGGFIGVIGSATGAADDPDANVFTSPQDVAVSASGMVYVTDYLTGTIVQLAPD